MVGIAVKVTEVPAQTGFAVAEIETLAGTVGIIVIITELLIAGGIAAHVTLEVIRQLTLSLFDGVYVYVGLFVPT